MTRNRREQKSSSRRPKPPLRQITTAILIDGGFYRKRAAKLFGHKTPEQRAEELLEYSRRHIRQARSSLYRVFYYDCPPSERVVYHPLLQEGVNLAKSDQYEWMNKFLEELTTKRKVAIRRGEELSTQGTYKLRGGPLKKLCRGEIQVSDLTQEDFALEITQKGVDMRIGLDIASLAERRLVNQIIMITGDSDFVPAAKHARRSGIDFILDPMWASVSSSLNEHVDGVTECVNNKPRNEYDPLHVSNLGPGSQVSEDEDFL